MKSKTSTHILIITVFAIVVSIIFAFIYNI